ncbi:hypothetical protein [Collinsella tanakaei]|uniref:hypothetical protein n=1 Tax=Collinsella tanakaei TaxID=626935 RepID=UPI00248E1C6E|nr:hypothetical protein [Collinsella tanakaei]
MKKYAAILGSLVMALALPVSAFAWVSPTGDVKAPTVTYEAPSGVEVKVAAACNGTGSLTITPEESVKASNAEVPEGFTEVASFKIESTGDVEPPYQFSYNLGAEYANAEVTVYVDHEGKAENEVVTKTASSDGTITFTTDALSIHTVVAKKADGVVNTDTGSTSPQTGLNTTAVAAGTVCVAVAAGAVYVARKKVSE